MAYKYAGRTFGVSADIVGTEIEKIEKEKGQVKPQDLVDVARPATSKLHNLFEWDDAKAGELYRRQQASIIIHSITVDVEEKETYSAFVNIRDGADKGQKRQGMYVNVNRALKDETNRQLLLRCAIRDLEQFKMRYSKLTELVKIFEAIDEMLKLK